MKKICFMLAAGLIMLAILSTALATGVETHHGSTLQAALDGGHRGATQVSSGSIGGGSDLKALYDEALYLLTQGRYAEAAAAFDNLFGYEDSNLYAMYAKALNAGESGDYALARKTFAELGDFRDSAMQIKYYDAREFEADGDFWSLSVALDMYNEMLLFRDASARSDAIRAEMKMQYEEALALGRQGAYEEAAGALEDMAEVDYQQAGSYYDYYMALDALAGDDLSAAVPYLSMLKGLGDFEDSRSQYFSCGSSFLNSVRIGDQIDFGYLEWYVLDIDVASRQLLLITSDTINEYMYFYGSGARTSSANWEQSNAREWLNDPYGGFLQSDYYFKDADLDLMGESTRSTSYYTAIQTQTANYAWTDPEGWEKSGSEESTEKAFLLSIEEAERYLAPLGLMGASERYWLRDVAYYNDFGYGLMSVAFTVHPDGSIGYKGNWGGGCEYDLRPALVLDLN